MRAIRSGNTAPEILLRKELWRRGCRYRLRLRLHGTRPDLVFAGSKLAVFVDGCFWHGCPEHYRPPVGNARYWREKIEGNQARDHRNDMALANAGWKVLRLWECAVERDPAVAADAVVNAIRAGAAQAVKWLVTGSPATTAMATHEPEPMEHPARTEPE
jgi:DNA mismatch endonuclease (patch repair protein)